MSTTFGKVVTDFGVVGDNTTDNTAALQALVNSSVNGTCFKFPRGMYKVSAPIDFSRLRTWAMEGESVQPMGNDGSVIIGKVTGNLVSANYGSGIGSFQVRKMKFINGQTTGPAFYSMNSQNSSFDECAFQGLVGLKLDSPFTDTLRGCTFNGQGGTGSQIGLQISGTTATSVLGCDFVGWTEGLRAMGSGLTVIGSRFEVNKTGMRLGADAAGNNWSLSRSFFSGISMEANDYHIYAQNITSSVFAGIGGQGSVGSPSKFSVIGLRIHAANHCTFQAMGIGGAYATAGISIDNNTEASNLIFDCVTASNGGGGPTGSVVKWNLPVGLQNVLFRNCNN